MRVLPVLPLSLLLPLAALAASADRTLLLREGDRICLVGNTLAERMQHHNHWETLLHRRFPQHRLVVRNLAWPADEVALRPRAEGFGDPEQHLKASRADVIIAFFGFNEAFAGPAGLPKFTADLEAWVTATLRADYSGRGAPRLALVSPIAHENLRDPHLPDGAATNRHLALYVAAMRDVAARHGIVFADLFQPTLALFAGPGGPYTINGVHLHARGDAAVAPLLDRALFGATGVPGRPDEALRAAIADKNFHWYHHHRVVNSYYVYGGRSGLKFADGPQTNRDVLERERDSLLVRADNRDARIWALARDGAVAHAIDDTNAPPPLPVVTSFGFKTNERAGANSGQTSKTAEGDSARILAPAETLASFKLAPGFAIDLFASEADFPELGNAVATAFDARGRLWVATMPSYPQWQPGTPMNDKLVILEDTDGDGRADRSRIFADDLHLPIGFEFARDGVLVSQQRELVLLRDTDGDDRADAREIVLSGFDSADSHHAISTFTFDPGGALYFQEGTFHHTQVETPYGPVRCKNAGTYRFEPRTHKLDVFVSYNFANPHGIAFDRWGQTFISDASPGANYFGTAFSGHLPYPEKHPKMEQWFPKRVRPTCATEFVSSRHFPAEMQGEFLLTNVIGVRGILRHRVTPHGSGYKGEEVEPLLTSADPNFRPVDLEFGPDGALYVTDWQDALIGHMQYSIRDPLRDRAHARIWRVTFPGRPLLAPARIAGAPIPHLLDLLAEPEDRTRIRAKQELARRPAADVLAALQLWLEKIDPASPEAEHRRLEGLWVRQWLDAPDRALLLRLLDSPEPRARAAATRVLCYWRDRVPDALALLRRRADDAHPLVRLEAVRAASFFRGRDALAVALALLDHERDYYLTYTLEETMRALAPSPAEVTDPRALAFVLGRMTNAELAAAPESEAVWVARLERKGLDAGLRDAALEALAKTRRATRAAELVTALQRLDERSGANDAVDELGRLLAAAPRAELEALGETIRRMASRDTGRPAVRRAALAARVALDGGPVPAWQATEASTDSRTALLDAIPLLSAADLRAALHPLLVALFARPPAEVAPNVRTAALRALPYLGAEHAAASFSLAAAELRAGRARPAAARALLALPREAWVAAEAAPTVEAIVAHARGVPEGQRSSPAFVELMQVAQELAGRLPADETARVRATLREFRVAVFIVKSVHEQMRFDVTEIAVEPGKPFEIVFENPDIMPHNLVIVAPGAREEIGLAAQAMPPAPDKLGRAYVPDSPKVLGATKMLEPGQQETLRLRAPETPGIYEFVCTFPGHWTIMWGRLLVGETAPRLSAAPPVRAAPEFCTAPLPTPARRSGESQ